MQLVVADTAADASTRATFEGGHGNLRNQRPPVPENGNVNPVTTSATSGVNGSPSVGAKAQAPAQRRTVVRRGAAQSLPRVSHQVSALAHRGPHIISRSPMWLRRWSCLSRRSATSGARRGSRSSALRSADMRRHRVAPRGAVVMRRTNAVHVATSRLELRSSDGLEPAGLLCRAAADLCDTPETCDGSTTACPRRCRAAGGFTGLAVGAFRDSELALATTLWPQLPRCLGRPRRPRVCRGRLHNGATEPA
jgi:hypothetical protein